MISPIAHLREAWRNRRSRIVISALLLGLFCGALDVTVPLEDLYMAGRTKLRHEVADGSIVIVKLDDRTLDALHNNDVNPQLDARVIAKLMAAGADQIFFDRTYPFSARSDGASDLTRELVRHPGQVYFGVARKLGGQRGQATDTLPADEFRRSAGLVSLAVLSHPLNLSYSFPYSSPSIVGELPSLASKVAGRENLGAGAFRPDFAIDHTTIPTVSYHDVLTDRFDPAMIKGRKVVIGWTSSTTEYRALPTGGFVPAVYFHVIAAQTLKSGQPLNLGWLPAFLIVAGIVITGVARRHAFKPMRVLALGMILLAAPMVLDYFQIELDVLPAMVMAAYAIFKVRSLDKIRDVSETNAASGLPSLQALRSQEDLSPALIVALKIRNYGGIIRNFSDAVEAELACEIQRRIRISEPNVTVFHEGDMFVWLSNLGDIVELFENLEGLHRIVQNGIVIEGTEIDVGINCGIDSETGLTLASRLASAMQSAQEAVRSDELVCHHDGVRGEVQWEISLLTSLDRAIDNGEVWVAFQPKLDLRTNRIIGAEALARWSHPERGPISPEKFIGIAEEYHRIERITRFVLDRAIRAAASVVRDGREDFSISVNISAQLLRNPKLPRMVMDALAAHDLAPEHLILEVTETDRLDRSTKTREMMEALTAAGLRISIDDFGTGNATIDYLRYLPASEVKIDKVFIRDIESNSGDHLLVQSIIEMAHSLGRQVVAEGVESGGSIEILRHLKCDQVQGYHVGRPVPFQEFLERLLEPELRSIG